VKAAAGKLVFDAHRAGAIDHSDGDHGAYPNGKTSSKGTAPPR
jgi:hypothetical protein